MFIPDGYNRKNAFWDSFGLQELVDASPDTEKTTLRNTIGRIGIANGTLPTSYQSSKKDRFAPLN